jgi:hypothetical protein
MSFHPPVSTLIPVFSDWRFLLYRSFTSFVKFIPRYLNFLMLLWMVLFSPFLSQTVHHLYIKRLPIFVYWFFILPLCWKCLWDLRVFWWSF